MSAKTHAILSELHRMLSTYTPADLMEASSSQAVTRGMRNALRALANDGDSVRSSAPHSRTGSVRSSRTSSVSTPQTSEQNGSLGVLGLVQRSPSLDSPKKMADFGRAFGLRIPYTPKDSRDRVGRRLASAIEKLPETRKNEVLKGLRHSISDQTAGWIDVIRKS